MSHSNSPPPGRTKRASRLPVAACSALCGLWLSGLFTTQVAVAGCTTTGNAWGPHTVNMPATMTLNPTPVGGVLARYQSDVAHMTFLCDYATSDVFPLTLDVSGLKPSSIERVYETGVVGVGIRFGFTPPGYGGNPLHFPLTYLWPNRGELDSMKTVTIDLIRTGVAVGSGSVPVSFTSRLKIPMRYGGDREVVYTSARSSIKLINNDFFTGCRSSQTSINVPMGKVPISHIKAGNAPQKNFAFEVSCYGLRPTKPIPVKMYFVGNAQADGMLKLADGGQGVAKGIGIALVNDKGVKLPFSKDRSLKLDWQRSEASAEVYRFSGNAMYAPIGGEITPGRGDAVMSLMIDYN